MSTDRCSCGRRFLDAEDFRDHLPCPGSATEVAYKEGYDRAIADVVSWLSESRKALNLPMQGPHVDAWDAVELVARRIKSGEWKE